jgi:hypothetical protein
MMNKNIHGRFVIDLASTFFWIVAGY